MSLSETWSTPSSSRWSSEHRALWQRIAAHRFENDGVALDFARRLARTLGWPLDETRALIEEYRRFCFLAMVGDIGPVTPSEEVDEVWHLHLAYTRDYWDRWCGEALGRRLHHDPTAGGPSEQKRYREQYAATLALYERWFGPPLEAFWPGTAQRFAAKPRFRFVDRRRAWVVPRFAWPTRIGLALPLLAIAGPARGEGVDWAAANPFDFDGPTFLWLYAALVVIAALVSWLFRDAARTSDRRPDLRDLGDIGLAYLVSGAERAADTLYLALAAHRAASIEGGRIVVARVTAGLPASLEAYRVALAGDHSRGSFKARVENCQAFADMLERLRARRILLGDDRKQRLVLATIVPGAMLLGFGLVKVVVGLNREKPVGFLLVLMAFILVALVFTLWSERYLTREARDCLTALSASRSRALRAPTSDELPFAFAMLGAVALDGTPHAEYARLVRADGSSGSSGCGSGGDGGGGCGGGGCGGCSS